MRAQIKVEGIELQTFGDQAVTIPLDELATPARILNWILQIAVAEWSSPDHLKDFLDCLDAASQTTFNLSLADAVCPCGKPRRLDWMKGEICEQLVQNYPSN